MRAKPRSATSSTHASAPPQRATSQSPRWTRRNASPTDWAPAAHAAADVCTGPAQACSRDTAPAAVLHSARGTKNGESFLPPATRCAASTISPSPPTPDAIDAPRRAGAWASRPPASRTASAAARSASATTRAFSRFSSSARSPQRAATNDAPSTSNCAAADSPRCARRQLSAALPPSGDAQPSPVTTTRRSGWWRRGGGSIARFCSLQANSDGVALCRFLR